MPDLSTCWVLVPAAGASTRFGTPKALASWENGTLLAHALTIAMAVSGDRVLVVLGAHADQLKAHTRNIHVTLHPQWEQGMGSSIAAGLQAILAQDRHTEAVLILPVDQPLVTAEHLIDLAETGLRTEQLVLTSDASSPLVLGPPACLPRCYFSAALTLQGSHGLKPLLKEIMHTRICNPSALIDADTPAALQALTQQKHRA